MTAPRRIGIVLIIVGAFIPSVLYPFTSLTTSATLRQIVLGSKGVVYKPRLNDLEVVLKEGNWIKDSNYQGHYEGRIVVPYHYTIASGIIMAFWGIGLIALTGKKGKKENE